MNSKRKHLDIAYIEGVGEVRANSWNFVDFTDEVEEDGVVKKVIRRTLFYCSDLYEEDGRAVAIASKSESYSFKEH